MKVSFLLFLCHYCSQISVLLMEPRFVHGSNTLSPSCRWVVLTQFRPIRYKQNTLAEIFQKVL